MKAAFPASERDLSISPNDWIGFEPNATTRRLGAAIPIALALLLLGGEIMMMLGGYHQGMPRARLLLIAAGPVGVILSSSFVGIRQRGGIASYTNHSVDFPFLVVLLPITAAGALLALWHTRKPPAARKMPEERQR